MRYITWWRVRATISWKMSTAVYWHLIHCAVTRTTTPVNQLITNTYTNIRYDIISYKCTDYNTTILSLLRSLFRFCLFVLLPYGEIMIVNKKNSY